MKALLLADKSLAKKENLEATDEGQNTPLIWAARQHSKIIVTIIAVKIITIIRWSMNHMLEVLIALGANVNYQGASSSLDKGGIRNSTALHWAVSFQEEY